MRDVDKEIFDCPSREGNTCPVAKKFKQVTGELPIPEAYLGNPESKFMIIGINPGERKNYICGGACESFEEYQNWLRQHVPFFWQYHYATELFGYPALKKGGGIVTNLVHCPTPSWTRQKEEKWRLIDVEKKKSVELCSQFCLEMIEEVSPDLILLHGLDVAKFFSNYCKWGLGEEAQNKDIHGLMRMCNGRTFVLSRHLRSIADKKGQGVWRALKEAAKKLENSLHRA